MIPTLVRFAVRRSLNDTRHISVVKRRHATGLVASVYRQIEADFGMLAPPTALHSASPSVMAASWAILRETLLVPGFASRAAKEAVATGVSEANECPYCADVHGMTLDSIEDAPDPSPLTAWARSTAVLADAVAPPCPPAQVPELVGVAVAFHYYNRVVNVFLRDSPFPSHVPESAKPKARKVLGGVLRPAEVGPVAGESLSFLPPAPLPDDATWASSNPVIASAFARAYAAVEAAGARSVPLGVRAMVRGRLSVWDGRAPGLSRAWVNDPVGTLPPSEQAAGRLALTIAMASYQVDDGMVAEFRAAVPGDEALVDLAAWASMSAARRVSSWVGQARPAAA
jgi:alkylhydroperoxidase family enzyme